MHQFKFSICASQFWPITVSVVINGCLLLLHCPNVMVYLVKVFSFKSSTSTVLFIEDADTEPTLGPVVFAWICIVAKYARPLVDAVFAPPRVTAHAPFVFFVLVHKYAS